MTNSAGSSPFAIMACSSLGSRRSVVYVLPEARPVRELFDDLQLGSR